MRGQPAEETSRADELARVPKHPEGAPSAVDTKKILIVEDDPDTQFIYTRFLTHHGYDVVLGTTGEEGVHFAHDEHPDAILMDVSIPGIDGWEASRRIKKDPTTAEIPIVVVTAHAFPEDRERAERLGCAGFLTKPCDLGRILATIRGFLNETADGQDPTVVAGGPGPSEEEGGDEPKERP